jgi:hypothetical protein
MKLKFGGEIVFGFMEFIDECIFGLMCDLFLYPEIDFIKDEEGVKFLVGLHGEDGPSYFLNSSEDFEDVVIKLVVGGEFGVIENNVVKHVFIGVIFLEFVEVFQQRFLVLCAFLIPLTVDR